MSNASSEVDSPYGSISDLHDDDDIRPTKKSTVRNFRRSLSGISLDDVELTVRSIQQEVADFKSDFSNLKSQSQTQSRSIHDLQMQFEEARVRIDRLLKRKPRSRSEYASDGGIVSSMSSLDRRMSDLSDSSALHKSEITINPSSTSVASSATVASSKMSFGAVTLTVKVDDE